LSEPYAQERLHREMHYIYVQAGLAQVSRRCCVLLQMERGREVGVQEGDDFFVIFHLLLETFQSEGLLDTLRILHRAARDTAYFHRCYAYEFRCLCDPPWFSMCSYQRREVLKAFMMRKFSLDPSGAVMSPPPGAARRVISVSGWQGFVINDDQMRRIVARAMDGYDAIVAEDRVRRDAEVMDGHRE
jgi:hypothetical protein